MQKFSGILFLLLSCVYAAPVDLLDKSSGLAGLASGSTGTARIDQISAPYYNPASLGFNTQSGVEFTYYQNMGLVNHSSLDGVLLLGEDMPPIGLNFVQEGINNIPRTSEANGVAVEEGSFSDEYRFFNLATAVPLSPGIYGGVNFKFISRSILDYSASGVAADIGLLQIFNKDLYLGANFHNLFSSLDWSTGTQEYLARKLTAGLAYHQLLLNKHTYFYADLDLFSEEERNWGIGAEAWIIDSVFCLRGGYNDRQEFSIGSGFEYYDFHCDLAMLFRDEDTYLDNTFLFGLGFDFNIEQNTRAQKAEEVNFQASVKIENKILTISNIDTNDLVEVALLDPEYNVTTLPLQKTISVPVSTGNYTIFFQRNNQQIIRKSVSVE